MQIDDSNFFEWVFKGLVGFIVTVLTWMAGRQVQATERNRDAIESHKLYSSDNYIKKDVIEGVHRRFDAADKASADNNKEIRKEMSEIKTLIINGLQGKH